MKTNLAGPGRNQGACGKAFKTGARLLGGQAPRQFLNLKPETFQT
jgi:hypothetical protein